MWVHKHILKNSDISTIRFTHTHIPSFLPGRWQAEKRKPGHRKHQEYIDDIQDLCLEFQSEMSCKNSSGQTLRQVLVNGIGFEHYAFLQNGCRALHSLSPQDRCILATGTTANEALHSQFNNCQRSIVQQHQESVFVVLQSFSMAKLLAHQLFVFVA